MKRVDAIFFDLDGTLIDSKDDIVAAVNHIIGEAGAPQKTYEEIFSYIGTGVEDLIARSIGENDIEIINKYVRSFDDYFKEHHTDKSKLYPNVEETLEVFSNKKLVIVTNRKKGMAERTLEKFGIAGYFRGIVGGDDISCIKPMACPVKKGLRMYVDVNEQALMVGDMDVDVLAGKAAGIMTCAVTYGFGKKEDILKAGPDITINDIKELAGIIE